MRPPTDSERVLATLVNLEQGVHRHGWDSDPASVWVMFDPQEPTRRLNTRRVPGTPGGRVGEAIERFADNLVTAYQADPCHPLLRVLADPGVVGVVVCDQTWRNDVLAEPQARAAEPRELADVPGSYEARVVWAVDRAGVGYLVWRRRGHKPLTAVGSPDVLNAPADLDQRVFPALVTVCSTLGRIEGGMCR